MAIMVSKFHGVPSTMKSAREQFEKLKKEENRPFNKGRYLVLQIQPSGMYKGLPVNYIYENKPKRKGKKIIKIYRFPKK